MGGWSRLAGGTSNDDEEGPALFGPELTALARWIVSLHPCDRTSNFRNKREPLVPPRCRQALGLGLEGAPIC